MYITITKLNNNKYWIGYSKTTKPSESVWCRSHGVIGIEAQYNIGDVTQQTINNHINKLLGEYINTVGWDNVRSSTYANATWSQPSQEQLAPIPVYEEIKPTKKHNQPNAFPQISEYELKAAGYKSLIAAFKESLLLNHSALDWDKQCERYLSLVAEYNAHITPLSKAEITQLITTPNTLRNLVKNSM